MSKQSLHNAHVQADKPKPKAGSRRKHVPQRTCVACRRTDAKRALLRVVRTAEGRVGLDPTGKQSGRGAYVCLDPDCWELALKRRSIERALRLETLHPEDRATLVEFMQGLERTSTRDTGTTQ